MTRRALIIAAPGPPGNILPGVPFDLQNYQNFLLSAAGGGWQPAEVGCMRNPSRVALLRELKRMQSDYTLVVFSGHGAMNQASGRSFVEINANGERVWAEELGTPATRQLLILDSCRNYVSTLAGIVQEGLQTFPSQLTIPQARNLFDKQLASCEAGQVVCHACEPGHSASDTLGGGLFSNVLFQVTQDWTNAPSPYTVFPIDAAFLSAHHLMLASSGQVPTLRYSPTGRQHWFPFAVRRAVQVF